MTNALRFVLGAGWRCLGRLHPGTPPGPFAIDLHFERPAQESADEDDEAQHANTLKRGRNRHGADNISRDQQFQPDEDCAAKLLP